MGFTITALLFRFMLYAKLVRGLNPTRAALLLVPMAIITIVLARPVGPAPASSAAAAADA